MFGWTLLFFIFAIIAGVFGFSGVAGSLAEMAQVLVFISIALLVISAAVRAFRGGNVS